MDELGNFRRGEALPRYAADNSSPPQAKRRISHVAADDGTMLMVVRCPKCPVTVREYGQGWNFDPSLGCVDLAGTEWAEKGDVIWCPTLAAAMPPTTRWPGRDRKAYVEAEVRKIRAGDK